MRRLIQVSLLVLAVLLTIASLLPLMPSEWWVIRLFDFPRLQSAVALLTIGLLLFAFARRWPRSTLPMLSGVALALTVHAVVLWPYRPSGEDKLDSCAPERRLSVLIANVQLGNRTAPPLIAAVQREAPDLFLAMETDAWWDTALQPLTQTMPHTLQKITGSYYGIHFFSRLPLVRPKIRHLAGQQTPAVVTGVRLGTGEVIDFVGVHPRPPQPWQSARARDAELYAASLVLRDREEPGILAGDLNATPWESAVERARRLARLIDPRRGYGYVPTWNAQSWWMKWPLDHIFHEGGFATLSLRRLAAFGSDHNPYLVRLCRVPQARSETAPLADPGDIEAANAVLSKTGAPERAHR